MNQYLEVKSSTAHYTFPDPSTFLETPTQESVKAVSVKMFHCL